MGVRPTSQFGSKGDFLCWPRTQFDADAGNAGKKIILRTALTLRYIRSVEHFFGRATFERPHRRCREMTNVLVVGQIFNKSCVLL